MAKKTQGRIPVVSGLLHIYGPPGSGKTSLAVTAGRPDKTVMLDGDTSKSAEIADLLGLKEYHDLTKLSEGKTEVEHFKAFLKLVDDLPEDLDVLVWDEPMTEYVGAHPYVHKNRKLFREEWATKGSIAGAQEWRQTRSVLLPQLHSRMLDKATLVIVATHEKPERDDDQDLTGFTLADADKGLEKMAGMRIRLGRNTRDFNSRSPVGLVLKNAGTFKDGEPVPVFPDRIAPCTWAKIQEYVANPIGNRDLEENEIPDEFERALITGALNPEQRRVYQMAKAWQRHQEEQAIAENATGDVIAAVAAIREENPDMPPPMLVNKVLTDLSDAYDLDKDQIESILSEAQE